MRRARGFIKQEEKVEAPKKREEEIWRETAGKGWRQRAHRHAVSEEEARHRHGAMMFSLHFLASIPPCSHRLHPFIPAPRTLVDHRQKRWVPSLAAVATARPSRRRLPAAPDQRGTRAESESIISSAALFSLLLGPVGARS